MTSRERVKRAIHFQGVDHIPHFLPDGKENDIVWFWTPREPDRQPWAVGADGLEHRTTAKRPVWPFPMSRARRSVSFPTTTTRGTSRTRPAPSRPTTPRPTRSTAWA